MIAPVFRRTWAISKAETSLYMRNRSIALTALLLTPLLVLASGPVILREENNASIPTMVLQLVVNTSLLLVVYFNLTAIFVARREDGVFQRMDTGEATRWETVVATTVPSAAVLLLQVLCGLLLAGLIARTWPVANPLLLMLALLLSLALFAACAAFTSSFCRTVESAQYGALPGFLFFYFLSGLIIPLQLFPEPVPTISRWSPLIAVNHLLTLSSGTDPLTNQSTTFLQSWIQAGQPLAALTVWLVLFAYLARRHMRFNRR